MHRSARYLGLALLSLAALSGCNKKFMSTTVSGGPEGVSTTVGGGNVLLQRWKEGPAIMICSDINQGTTDQTAGTSSDSGYKGGGSQAAPDGRRYEWQTESMDGRNVKFRINGKEYDLSKGTLFLVKTKGGKTEVEQLSEDLSSVQPNAESCKEFARKNPAVSKFLDMKDD
jgi:hypothetical protein